MKRSSNNREEAAGSSTEVIIGESRNKVLKLDADAAVTNTTSSILKSHDESLISVPIYWTTQLRSVNVVQRSIAIVNARTYLHLVDDQQIKECTQELLERLEVEDDRNVLFSLINLLGDWCGHPVIKSNKECFENVFEKLIKLHYKIIQSNQNNINSNSSLVEGLSNKIKPMTSLLHAFQKLNLYNPDNRFFDNVIEIAIESLLSHDARVCTRALLLLGSCYPITELRIKTNDEENDIRPITTETKSKAVYNDEIIQDINNTYSKANDPRIRAAALQSFNRLYIRGLKLSLEYYSRTLGCLCDSHEFVRIEAIKLVLAFSILYPVSRVVSNFNVDNAKKAPKNKKKPQQRRGRQTRSNRRYSTNNENINNNNKNENYDNDKNENETATLKDNAFAKMCNMVNDPSYKVRAFALTLLAKFDGVNEKLLLQTLDKKVMSHLRRKKTVHEERAGETPGIHAAGDTEFDPEEITIMDSGACGALVLGLEDEFSVVRSASIDALCKMSEGRLEFGRKVIDFLVDMFNDEIDDVRLKAVLCLCQMTNLIEYSKEQIDILLSLLCEEKQTMRYAVQRLLGLIKVATCHGVEFIMEHLLLTLEKFPQDHLSIWKTVSLLGKNNPSFAQLLLDPLLNVDRRFVSKEPDVDDYAYIAKIIFIFNAASENPSIVSLCSLHNFQHYLYLKDRIPSFFSQLVVKHFDLLQSYSTTGNITPVVDNPEQVVIGKEGVENQKEELEGHISGFLKTVDEQITTGLHSLSESKFSVSKNVWTNTLRKLGQSKKSFPQNIPQIQFYIFYVHALQYVLQIKECLKGSFSAGDTVCIDIAKQLVYCTHQLENLFTGLTEKQRTAILSLCMEGLLTILILSSKSKTNMNSVDSILKQLNKLKTDFVKHGNKEQEKLYEALIIAINQWISHGCGNSTNQIQMLLSLVMDFSPPVISNVGAFFLPQCKQFIVKADYCESGQYPGEMPISLTLNATFIDLFDPSSISFQIEFPEKTILVINPRITSFTKTIHENKYTFKQSIQLSLVPSSDRFSIIVQPVIKCKNSNTEDYGDGDVWPSITNENGNSIALGHVAFCEIVSQELQLHPEMRSTMTKTVFGNRGG